MESLPDRITPKNVPIDLVTFEYLQWVGCNWYCEYQDHHVFSYYNHLYKTPTGHGLVICTDCIEKFFKQVV